jgi:undecaprenyl-phosphate 4-deoxy-4-formamido-L-arabinose transferase
MTPPSVSVVIPVFNSAATLPELVRRLAAVLAPRGAEYEFVLVNDGSRDGSWEVIRDLAAKEPAVRGINLMRNYGQHGALLCGIRAARHQVIVTMDDDLQHPPEEIPKLAEKLAEGHDVVYGTPASAQHDVWRRMASWLTRVALRSALGAKTASEVSAFRVFRAELRRGFVEYRGPDVAIDVLLAWGARHVAALTVRHDPRRVGASNYTVRKLMAHALNMMTGFSTLPLRLASLVGFGVTLFGLGVLVTVIVRYVVLGGSVPGFPFLASVIAIFSGAQLFALGVIGEYLARIHFRMMERPTYVVRSTTFE